MQFLTKVLLVLSLIMPSLTPLSPLTSSVESKYNTKAPIEDTVSDNSVSDNTEIVSNNQVEKKYKINNFLDADLEGFCTIGVPQSHFKIVESDSTYTKKNMLYKDNRTKITMSYITKMDNETDIPGYITTEVAGVDTFTNDKQPEYHSVDKDGNPVEWMMVPSQNQEDNCNVYVWYTLSEDKTAAFWLKLKAVPESDDEELHEAINEMLDTYSNYFHNGTVFDTPDTGFYEGFVFNDGTVGDVGNYRRNDLAFQVFQTRGGYIEGADISADWQDLEIIIDRVKFKLPCEMQDFYDAGYVINDRSKTDADLQINKLYTSDIKVINENGTVVTVTVLNDSASDYKHVDNCKIMSISLDSSYFVDITDKALLQALAEQKAKNKGSSEIEEVSDLEEETTDESSSKTYKTKSNLNLREQPNTECNILVMINLGDTVTLIEEAGEWFKVSYNDKEGYVKAEYLEEVVSETTTEETKTETETKEVVEDTPDTTTDTASDTNDAPSKDDEFVMEGIGSYQILAEEKAERDKEKKEQEESDEESDETDTEKDSDDEEELDGELTDGLESTNDITKHQLILMGGVTWNVYKEDLISYVGEPTTTSSHYDKNNKSLVTITWTNDEGKKMIIDMGSTKGIKSVMLSCLSDSYTSKQ